MIEVNLPNPIPRVGDILHWHGSLYYRVTRSQTGASPDADGAYEVLLTLEPIAETDLDRIDWLLDEAATG